LCVIDKLPRELRADQKQALLILARHVVSQLELRRRSRELVRVREENEKAKTEVEELRVELAEARRQLAHNGRRHPAAPSLPKVKRSRKSRLG
jgi:hypothetical protein